jgi:adenylate kinase
MRIIITGTPGSGKTGIAKELADKTGWELIDLKKFINQNHLFTIFEGHKEVDIPALKKHLLPYLKQFKDYIVEGHLACEIEIPADYIIVLRTHPKTLKARMQKRRYKKKKLDENLEAEMLDYCTQRVEFVYGKTPMELDTTKRTIPQCATEILKAIKQKKIKIDSVDYAHELKIYLRLRT